jgi:hypothetical protein
MSFRLSFRNNYVRYAGLALILLYLLIESRENGDFTIFLSASSDLAKHGAVYSTLYKQWYHYYYSPLFALLLYPLTLIPFYAANLIWLTLNAVFVFRTWKALCFFMDRTLFTEKQKFIFTLLCFFFIFRFLKDNFHLGQMTLCMLYLSIDGMYRIMTGRYWLGALLISVAINIKILPLVLIPYLLYRRYFKACAFLLLFFALWLFLPALVLGMDYNNLLLHQWWTLLNPTNKEHVIDTAERSFHGLSSWLPTLLMDKVDDPQVLPIKRNIANLSVQQIGYLLNVVRLALMLFTFYFLRSLPFKRAQGKLHAFRELAYIFLIIPLLFPHQQHYAFYFLFPAGTYIIYYLATQTVVEERTISVLKFRIICTGIVLIFLTNNLQFILGEFGPLYEHFKIITYGALLMIPLLAVCKPEEIPVRKEEEMNQADNASLGKGSA